VFKGQYAETAQEADQWLKDNDSARRTPDLLPRDEVARAINSEVKGGRGTEHGGVYLDIASRLPADEIMRRLPSMHHQFLELADVDITKEQMEVGPTCHYVMGGVEVDPDTAMSTVPGLFAAGECSGGMHGSNRLGGNSLSDLLVFGRRAGTGAAEYLDGLGVRPQVSDADVTAAQDRALLPFSTAAQGGENPFVVHVELQRTMNDLVGIIRKADEMEQALKALEDIATRTRTVSVSGGRAFNPSWHLALDLRNMLLVSLCVARAALERQESRGGHTRDDFPVMDSDWRHVLLVLSMSGGEDSVDSVELVRREQLPMRPELFDLFEMDELKKYYTGEELGGHRADATADATADQGEQA
ncbi:MAG: FAD-binding protein, partial [Pseudonocardia sp.]